MEKKKFSCRFCGREIEEGGFCDCREAVSVRLHFVPCGALIASGYGGCPAGKIEERKENEN